MSAFTWQRVRGRFGITTSFVSDVFDQHMVSWCGCCFIVAVVQCIEDRGHILLGHRVRLDMQSMVNYMTSHSGRNACRGGLPIDVIRCIMDGVCPMMRHHTRWMGRPMSVQHVPLSNVPYRVADANNTIKSDRICDVIRSSGPVILIINAETLKNVDATGMVTDLSFKVPNHAVTVVGWREDNTWVVRNSWGRMRVPKSVPDNIECVDDASIECRIEWEYWVGDPNNPGSLYLPMSAAALQPPHTPWVVPRVVVS